MALEHCPGETIRWGVVGTGWITAEKLLPAIRRSRHGIAYAVCSRDLGRAQALASAFDAPGAYADLGSMLADPGVDAVYVGSRTVAHIEALRAALAAGKPVLCEKPLGMDMAECAWLRDLPHGHPPVMEAFMFRHHPQWRRVMELVRGGVLGRVRAVETSFCYFNDDPASGTNALADGGGAMRFVGCYAVAVGRLVFGAEPVRVALAETRDPRFGTDVDASGVIEFPAGRLVFHVSTLSARHQRVTVLGEDGKLTVQIPYNTPETEPVGLVLDLSDDLSGASAKMIRIGAADHYAEEADALARAVLRGEEPEWGVEDALANMAVLDALREAGRSGGWVRVARDGS